MTLIETARTPIWIADGRHDGADQPVVILVHGAAGSRLDWSAEMRRLRAGVIAVDLPGHGKSPAPGRSSVPDYAADLVALLDALALPQAVIIGHSMGGALALQLALDHAKRVRGIGLIGTGARLAVHPDILTHALTDQAVSARLVSNWFWAEGVDEAQRQASFDSIMQTPPEIMHGDFLAVNSFDVRPRLGEIHLPTLIIGAEQDRMTPVKYSRFLHDGIAGSTLVTVEHAGHKMIVEQPRLVADAVQNWLDQIG